MLFPFECSSSIKFKDRGIVALDRKTFRAKSFTFAFLIAEFFGDVTTAAHKVPSYRNGKAISQFCPLLAAKVRSKSAIDISTIDQRFRGLRVADITGQTV
jgi:hypothetical protein